MTLRWKMEPPETGLRACTAGPRSHWLHEGKQRLACVSPSDRLGSGWYFVAGWDSGVRYRNTSGEPADSFEQAKRDAEAYVREQLARLPAAHTPSIVTTTGETR